MTLCEKIRASIEALTIRHEHSLCGALTISIGICAIKPELEENFLSSIRNADYALYEAKKQGKNKVVQSS